MIEVKIRERYNELGFFLFDYEFGDFPLSWAAMSRWEWAYVWGVGTAPAYQNRGYCKAVMQTLVNVADKQGHSGLELNVYSNNTPALRVYESVGFTIYRDCGNYYRMERKANP